MINENEDIDYDDLAAIFLEEDEPEIYELQVSDIEVDNSQFKYSNTLGYFWILMDTFGYFWILLDTFGYFWILLNTFGYFWILLDTFEYL